MTTQFPTALQDLDATRGNNTDKLSSPNHVTHHQLEDDTIEALQAKVGIDGSAVTTSHSYKLSEITSTDVAVGKSATQTLSNKTYTGVSLAVTGAVTSSGTAGIGYATGAGGTVTQATSKSTGVTLNKITGQITMNNASLASATTVSFTLTNSTIAAGDILIINHIQAGTAGAYTVNAQCAGGSASINVRNVTGGSLGEAIVLVYAVIKAVTS